MLKATPFPVPVGRVDGLEYLVPKPEPDHGYAETNGDVLWLTAIAELSELNATPFPKPVGNVAGLVYFVPNPEPDHG
jgi:hypothetical protein